ncbi:chromosome partitioning protein ParA [Vibrio quintilis]|uniref:Tyrosine-protein kinase YwqD n=1 Tax=Vibrio quintilis TaxID=1117707 RepID=A0A1M7YR20_9VIBR|nr:chromosome partitioning protein ParA [Vibrio quintilis]SHO55074.1 Tyrosine-protein kinase YwqD [Vibrio quintilis]
MIPATHAEVEQIYLAAEMAGARSVCITACQTGEGVTSVASALTERYLLAGHQTLLVDLNLFNPAFSDISMLPGDTAEQWIEHKETSRLFTGLSIPGEPATLLRYKDPAILSGQMQSWLQQFDRVIVDTSPLLNINRGNIPAHCVASVCDQTILVVMGGVTSSSQLKKAMTLLGADQISLLGTILNGRDQPPLRLELIRELNRIPLLPARLKQRLTQWLMKSDMLSTYA